VPAQQPARWFNDWLQLGQHSNTRSRPRKCVVWGAGTWDCQKSMISTVLSCVTRVVTRGVTRVVVAVTKWWQKPHPTTICLVVCHPRFQVRSHGACQRVRLAVGQSATGLSQNMQMKCHTLPLQSPSFCCVPGAVAGSVPHF
jgi:hypothetical protein